MAINWTCPRFFANLSRLGVSPGSSRCSVTCRRIGFVSDKVRTAEGTIFVRMNEGPFVCLREHREF